MIRFEIETKQNHFIGMHVFIYIEPSLIRAKLVYDVPTNYEHGKHNIGNRMVVTTIATKLILLQKTYAFAI